MAYTVADLVKVLATNMGGDIIDPRICSVGDPLTYSALEEFAMSETDGYDDSDAAEAEYERITRTGPITGTDLLLAAQWSNGRKLI